MNKSNRQAIVESMLCGSRIDQARKIGRAFAPTNIALCKYWGKRDCQLNLPVTDSLSITLRSKGAYTTIEPIYGQQDVITINGSILADCLTQQFADYFDLIVSAKRPKYQLDMQLNIPVAAGLASSACCYASIIKALDHLYDWQLLPREMSILARFGSGSACRSLWSGFVKWQHGERKDGLDSHGVPLNTIWSELRVGLCIVSREKKYLSSREAMIRSVGTSPLYKTWSSVVTQDLVKLEQALLNKDFALLGETSEANALAMHEMMHQSKPAINYNQPATLSAQKIVAELRRAGKLVFFTQDAGPNLKLLFLMNDTQLIKDAFPDIEIIAPFADLKKEQVVLVDSEDRALDVCDKMIAHMGGGKLHRAISVCIVRKHNGRTELLLQKRQQDKYHCGGLWANTCCSHPRPGEDVISAGERRLKEEMGIVADLYLLNRFVYRSEFSNGLTEHELDYVLFGEIQDDNINYNRAEVSDIRWIESSKLNRELTDNFDKYVPWLPQVLIILEHLF